MYSPNTATSVAGKQRGARGYSVNTKSIAAFVVQESGPNSPSSSEFSNSSPTLGTRCVNFTCTEGFHQQVPEHTPPLTLHVASLKKGRTSGEELGLPPISPACSPHALERASRLLWASFLPSTKQQWSCLLGRLLWKMSETIQVNAAQGGVHRLLLMFIVACDRFPLFHIDLILLVLTHWEQMPKAKICLAIAPRVDRMTYFHCMDPSAMRQWAFTLRPRSAEWVEIVCYKSVHCGVLAQEVGVLSKSMFSPWGRMEAGERQMETPHASQGQGLELALYPPTHILDAKASHRAMPSTHGVGRMEVKCPKVKV